MPSPMSTPSSPAWAPAAPSWAPGDRLRESFPDVIVAAAEPLQGDLVYGLRSLADGYVPPILDVSKLDRKVLVTNEESVEGLRALLDREGIFAGVSSGAVIHVARRVAEELDEGVVVAVLADGGWKYLSADFWTRRPARSARPWKTASGGDPVRGALGARRARRGGAAQRGLRPHRRSATGAAERYFPGETGREPV